MFKAKIDKTKNLLLIIIADYVSEEEAFQCFLSLEKDTKKLKPCFRVITDVSKLDSMDRPVLKHIEKIMDLCNEHGVKKVVRVIPDQSKDIGFNIMSIFHYNDKVKYVNCKTMKEALKELGLDH